MRSIFSFKKIITLIFIMASFFIFLSSSTLGLQAILFITKQLVPGDLQIQTVKGKLSSNITLENILYQNNNIQVDIKFLQLSWNATYLLKKKILINSLFINNISIHERQRDANKQKVTKNSFSWAKYFVIRAAIIKNIVYLNQKQFIQVNKLVVTKNADHSNNVSIISPYGNINGYIDISYYPTMAWAFILNGENINPGKIFPGWDGLINIRLKSSGQWNTKKRSLQIQLENLQGQLKHLPVRGTANIAYNNGNLEIKKSEFAILNAKVNIAGQLTQAFAIRWQVSIPKLNLISSKISGSIVTSGEVTGSRINPQVHAAFKMLHPRFDQLNIQDITGNIDSTLTSNQLAMHLAGNGIKYNDYVIPHIMVNTKLQLTKANVLADSSIYIDDENKLTAHLNFPAWYKVGDFSQPFATKIYFDFKRLPTLIQTAEIKQIKGSLSGFAEIAGSFNNILVHLMAQLNNGSVYIPKANLSLESIALKTEYRSYYPASLSGKFRLGKGFGFVKGNIDIEKPGLPGAFTIDGDEMQLRDINKYTIIFSPHLKIVYAGQKLNIQGKINIPSAKITPHDFSQVTTLPSEIIIVGETNSAQWHVPNLTMHVGIKLNNIKLQYKNVDTILGGSLTISQLPNGLPTAIGTLNMLTGHYKIYGRNLTINDGRMIYTGNALTNPGLDIRAIQTFAKVSFAEDQNQFYNDKRLASIYAGTNKLIVGVMVKGDLSQPKVTFFSDTPNLSQNDILSYLVFGVPRSQIAGANAIAFLNSLVASSYTSSSNMSVDKISEKIENTLNLTELNVGSTEIYDSSKNVTSQTTTVNIGRQLGEKLSVHYKTGVFTSVSILNLEYKINKHLAIQTETNSLESGADLLYEIDVD